MSRFKVGDRLKGNTTGRKYLVTRMLGDSAWVTLEDNPLGEKMQLIDESNYTLIEVEAENEGGLSAFLTEDGHIDYKKFGDAIKAIIPKMTEVSLTASNEACNLVRGDVLVTNQGTKVISHITRPSWEDIMEVEFADGSGITLHSDDTVEIERRG